MADALISIRGDLSDITEKFAQLRGQMQALDSQAAAPAAAAITDRFKSVGAAIAGVGAAMTAIGGAVGAFGFEAAKGAGKTAESLELLRQKTGLTTDELRQLTPLFNRFNTDLNALTGPFRVLSKNFEEAAAGSEKAQAKFKALGIEISTTDKPIDVLGKVADAAARLGPGFERNTAMAALMGRGINALTPILAEGSAGMAQSAVDAQRMGLMLGKVTEGQLKDMDDAFDNVGTAMKAFHDTIGTAFAPVLLQLAQALTAVLGAFNRWFQGLDDGTKQLAVVFTGTFAIGGPILVAVGAFVAALAVITAPMLVAGAIIVGVVAALALIIVKWQELKALGTTIWTGLTTTIVGAARAIYDGIVEWLVNKTAALAAKVQGVATAIAKPFEWLADHLVGHSVIPDMVDDIGRHMELLDTRMGSPARIATANTLQAFRQMQLSVGQIMGQLVSVTISTWGNVTNVISSALSKNITQGNNWAQTWKSIQDLVLQGFINLGLQMLTQGAITLAKKLLFESTEATAHTAMETAKTAATATAEGTRLGIVLATNKASMAATISSLGVIGAVGEASLGVLEAVILAVGAVFEAIAAGLAASIIGAPFAPAFVAAGVTAMAAGQAGLAISAGAIQAAIGTAIVAATTALATPFASGGLVLGPTLALIGEAGPEMVVPLDRAGGVGGGNMTIILEQDGREMTRTVMKYLPGMVRMKTGLS